MKFIFAFIFSLSTIQIFSQDDLLSDLLKTQDTTTLLLPKKMLFTQRVLWGEKGLLRPIAPLNAVNREKELKLRRRMLVTHQILGFATLGGMIGQGIVGSQLYKQYNPSLKNFHEGLGTAVTITYSTTAFMSLFTPPPLINRDKKLSSIRIHKWLSLVHMSGMIATNILADKAGDSQKMKTLHRTAAYVTFASFGAAVITIKFK